MPRGSTLVSVRDLQSPFFQEVGCGFGVETPRGIKLAQQPNIGSTVGP